MSVGRVRLFFVMSALAGLGLLIFHDHPGPFAYKPSVRLTKGSYALHGRIDRVVDGDTVYIHGLGSSRLIGIDTPEVYGEDECYGHEASAYTSSLLPAGTPVDYELGREQRDRYGRALVYLWLRDGRSVNALLVAGGYATTLTIPPNTTFEQPLADLERQARSHDRGLWKAC